MTAAQGEAIRAQNANWAAKLDDLIPAIDACLARAENKPARVTIAYAEDDKLISVRLLDAEGGRYECKTRPTGGAVRVLGYAGRPERSAGRARSHVYARACSCRKASKEGCQKSDPAKAADGHDLGWLTRSTC